MQKRVPGYKSKISPYSNENLIPTERFRRTFMKHPCEVSLFFAQTCAKIATHRQVVTDLIYVRPKWCKFNSFAKMKVKVRQRTLPFFKTNVFKVASTSAVHAYVLRSLK